MAYTFKKVIFFLLTILSLAFTFYWFMYGIANSFSFGKTILKTINLWRWFEDEIVQLPALLGLFICTITAIIFLIFYRQECRVWPKLMLLFTGTVVGLTSSDIVGEIWYDYLRGPSSVGSLYKIILTLYALFSLATFIYMIITLIKYPKAIGNPT